MKVLRRLRAKLAKRLKQRKRQTRLWRKTHLRGHAKAASKDAQAVRYLRFLIRKIRGNRPNGPTVMYDSVTLDQIPTNAPAVAGYTSGHWPTYNELKGRFPKARRLSIAVNSSHDADCLDIEPGDAEPKDAPAWVKRQHRRGVKRPVVYGSVSNMPAILHHLSEAGIKRSSVRVWTAHYTYHAHRCGPHTCGLLSSTVADGTQWTDKALGRNLDQSLLSPTFFD